MHASTVRPPARRIRQLSQIIALGLLLPAAGSAQLANPPPVPEWLGSRTQAPEMPQTLQTRFEHRGVLLKAILLLASESAAQVVLNGEALGSVHTGPGEAATSLDVTRRIRAGVNELQVTAVRPRIAALLELNGDLARQRWLASSAATWTAAPGTVEALGAVNAAPANNPFDLKKTFDAYNSWQLAKRERQSRATDPADFQRPPGYAVELVRSAQPEEDSWVALTFAPAGRLLLAREKRGLLRFDPRRQTMAVVEDSLLECRGLLQIGDTLFAHANNSKALYRLEDADGDGRFDAPREILRTGGGVGHGRNHLKQGPDGRLWIACGNNVLLPEDVAPASPLRRFGWDQVLPNPWDSSMFDGTVELPAGYILSLNPDGSDRRLIAGGLRNPLDLAFNRDGELFTFDADMERDVGTPWYMPNRVLHVVSGSDFGWRRGTGRLAAWQADTLPAAVNIGLASPTAVFFGYGARFPARDQEALFICDWSYGRILRVELEARGASYGGRFDTFLAGRPLNVTDACIGPDGALWFITGGRGTQSGLYRMSYTGPDSTSPSTAQAAPSPLRDLRRQLEALHAGVPATKQAAALALALPALDHDDRHVRWAARLALEALPAELWQARILNAPAGWRTILGGLALARVSAPAVQPDLVAGLAALPWSELSAEQQLAALRALAVSLARHGDPTAGLRQRLLARFEPLYPAASRELNQELCRLLVRLRSERVLAATLPLLRAATASEDLLFYPLHLRHLDRGWTLEARRVLFEALQRAEKLNGASTYFKAIQDTRSELAAALSPAEASELAAIIHPPKAVPLSPHALPGHTYKAWKLADLEPRLEQVGRGRSAAQGRDAAIRAQCVFCHRLSPDAALPAGVFGPDLVQVSARFSRRDLLDHILNPSKVIDEKYRFLTLTRSDGTQVTGSLESEDDERLVLKPHPLAPETVEIGKSSLRERRISELSPMPAGLLDSLRAEQILDLLAFLEAGGDPQHRNFQP